MLNGVIAPVSSANTPSILTSAGTALTANGSRAGWKIQNLGTNPLFILEGDGASTSVFHHVLAAGTVNDNGTGGSISFTSGIVYKGIISVAGTTPRFVVTEYYE